MKIREGARGPMERYRRCGVEDVGKGKILDSDKVWGGGMTGARSSLIRGGGTHRRKKGQERDVRGGLWVKMSGDKHLGGGQSAGACQREPIRSRLFDAYTLNGNQPRRQTQSTSLSVLRGCYKRLVRGEDQTL